jgi:hypothetical protein
MVEQLTDEKKMLRLIRQKGNLSAPGYDALTFSILKLEAEASAKMMVELMRSLITGGKCPPKWKVGKTILLYKAGDDQNPANYRPITLTSILYRIIFGRISQEMMGFEDRTRGKTVFSLQQKGFVPRISGCVQHTYMANMVINRAMTEMRNLYIVAIDMKDAFGSVSHRLLEHNLMDMFFPEAIRNFVLDSYHSATVNIFSKKGMTNAIPIKRGMKQGCPLSPLLFNSCLDSLIRKMNTPEMKQYGFKINNNLDDNIVC